MPHSILVVDDEPGILHSVALALEDEGYLVRAAPNGFVALQLHAEMSADLIVSDVMMPLLDGHTMVDTLRARHDETPVILMSAAAFDTSRHPDVLILPKPFNLEMLFMQIETALNHR
jgi:DNA-binding response OmpR family regulator